MQDEDEQDPAEIEAEQHDLNYIKLDGSIGVHSERRWACYGDHGHYQIIRGSRRISGCRHWCHQRQ